MRAIRYTGYFLRSLALRGPLNTILLGIAERRWEKRLHISTTGFGASHNPAAHHYQGAAYRPLIRTLRAARQLTGDLPFVDIGCGKGRAVIAAVWCAFSNAAGFDLDAALVAEARRNASLLRRTDARVRFDVCNATEYSYPGGDTVYFLFNPFGREVLDAVIKKIASGTDSSWFIYMNPVHADAFRIPGITRVSTIKSWLYTEAIIFRYARS